MIKGKGGPDSCIRFHISEIQLVGNVYIFFDHNSTGIYLGLDRPCYLGRTLVSVVCYATQLHQTSRTDKEIHCSKAVVDWRDNERVPNPDKTGTCQRKVLGHAQFLRRTTHVLQASRNQTPLHQWCPKKHRFGASGVVYERRELGRNG